ncbi:CPBP family intramembrane glutamic endopeptidase [Chengkuizengella axinellae]|uniref:CPBP family intramembrane metalloprotease n=1 Tax=Chengkuizengella axinellae TaxID=3064388 RepID=A0ABT9IY28_9BACL|nr:CPBP family intramembrane glutamic endopeptidase [Chengkuizengella sp. 2205SS18-9]MDP5273705.1 CPBP family intramembrane metalloprotease [Chengkuizengella sp. 2205SS18-9]
MKVNKKVISFIVLVFVLMAYPYYSIITNGIKNSTGWVMLLAMWSPGISAVIIKLYFDRNIKGFGWEFKNFKLFILSYFIPFFIGLLIYSIAWMTGLGELQPLSLLNLILLPTLGVMMSSLFVIGEEIGWRGFLLPEIYRTLSYTKTSFVIAAIWCIYHYPILFLGGYHNGTSVWLSFLFFTLSIIGVSFVVTWIRIKSDSIWPAVLIHSSHNLFFQQYFNPMTVSNSEYTEWFTTEFGAGAAVLYGIAGYYFWRKRHLL